MNAFPTGAPTSQCSSLRPFHGNASDEPNYRLVVSETRITSDGYVNLTIEAISEKTFKGFIIQAREESIGTPVGTFLTYEKRLIQTINCNEDGDTITHDNGDREIIEVIEATWFPPKDFEGTVVFT